MRLIIKCVKNNTNHHFTKILSFITYLNLLGTYLPVVNDNTLVKLKIFITVFLNKNFLSYFILYTHSLSQKSCFYNNI